MKSTFINKNIVKTAMFLAAISLLWFGAFGLLRHSGEMKSTMTASGCLFDGGQEVCAMDVSDHVSTWQGMFTGLPQNANQTILILFAIVLVLVAVFFRGAIFDFSGHTLDRKNLYVKQQEKVPFFDFLREAFSGGILNSKIYA